MIRKLKAAWNAGKALSDLFIYFFKGFILLTERQREYTGRGKGRERGRSRLSAEPARSPMWGSIA